MSNWNADPKPEKPEKDSLRTNLAALAGLGLLTLLASAPAIVIGLWKWALG